MTRYDPDDEAPRWAWWLIFLGVLALLAIVMVTGCQGDLHKGLGVF